MRNIGIILLAATVSLTFVLFKISAQDVDLVLDTQRDEKLVTISSKDKGFPHVSFDDGYALGSSNTARSGGGATARSLVAEDFDGDGTQDIIVADSTGSLYFYRGNVDSIYPNQPEAQMRKASGTFVDQPFYSPKTVGSVPVNPELIESGDFNADGYADIVVAARGGDRLYVVSGNGQGGFMHTTEFPLGSRINDIVSGEIGKRDGLKDLAVSISGEKGNIILLFQHPEGAFVHAPEAIAISSPATSLIVGMLDSDGFGDVAAAGGNRLTMIRGRGHIYPWDRVESLEIERPSAVVETRQFPFEILGLEAGGFTDKRGDSVVMLSSSGSLVTLEVPQASNFKMSATKGLEKSLSYLPAGSKGRDLLTIADSKTPSESAFENKPGKFEEVLEELRKKENQRSTPTDSDQREKDKAKNKLVNERVKSEAISEFIKSIKPVSAAPLAKWKSETLFTDSRLAGSNGTSSLVKVRVSDSGRDELAVVGGASNSVQLFTRGSQRAGKAVVNDSVLSLETASKTIVVLPMRLNRDALSDLVVLTEGSNVPNVVMTAPAFTLVVNSTDDNPSCGGGYCTLRGALAEASSNSGPDVIEFAIGSGPAKIVPVSGRYTEVATGTTIDATTQPGYAGMSLIEISGESLEGQVDGLSVDGSSVVVRGLAINRFRGDYDFNLNGYVGGNGISVYSLLNGPNNSHNIIEGNFLGTDPTGTIDRGNDYTGLNIYDADHTTVGGTVPAARNLMSGSGTNNSPDIPRRSGVGISMTDGKFTKIKGNYIGTNASGTGKINNSAGIRMASGNSEIGGDEAGAGNVISGNGDAFTLYTPDGCIGNGLTEDIVVDPVTGDFLTTDNVYKGNRIGTTADGSARLGNCSTGLWVNPRNSAWVGSITESGRNTVSGNSELGIWCSHVQRGYEAMEPTGLEIPEGTCTIVGNNVGTDVSGTVAIPNDETNTFSSMIIIFGAAEVYNTNTLSNIGAPGGTSEDACTGYCNLISGNESIGASRGGYDGEVGIFSNYIGTNKAGSSALGNNLGIELYSAGNTYIGVAGMGNIISGSKYNAVNIYGSGSQYQYWMQGNKIGTNASGTVAIPNYTSDPAPHYAAVSIIDASVYIGGPLESERNIISGNNVTGISVGSTTAFPVIANNYIGVGANLQPLGNGYDGIRAVGSYIQIGGYPELANVIANNERTGVFVHDAYSNWTGLTRSGSNLIRYNSIYDNGGLGIDLTANTSMPASPDGVTANDCLDTDLGANGLQNYPSLSDPVFNPDGTVSVESLIMTAPGRTYVIDYYASTNGDNSGYGEGGKHIGSMTITTSDFEGISTFLFNSSVQVTPGMKITATATDSAGNTSEFSCIAGQCTPQFNELKAIAASGGGQSCSAGVLEVTTTGDQPDPSPANEICDVDLNTPGLQCTLRAAIQTVLASNNPNGQIIRFNIPGSGIQHILLNSNLPPLTKRVWINGTSQPGYTTSPVIRVTGGASVPFGLQFNSGSDYSQVSGISFAGFGTEIILRSNNNEISENMFGLNADGLGIPAEDQRSNYGVVIQGQENKIGTETPVNDVRRNYFAAHGIASVVIEGPYSGKNKVVANSFGFLIDGDLLPGPADEYVGEDNILITESSQANIIGGTTDDQINLIGNAKHGVRIDRDAHGNTISHNIFRDCENGVFIGNSFNNTIGGTNASGSGNIFYNNEVGVEIGYLGSSITSGANQTKVEGNSFGLSPDPKLNANTHAIVVVSGSNNVIGSTAGRNYILNSQFNGITVIRFALDTQIVNNFIGTSDGTSSASNEDGIHLEGRRTTVQQNVISGNRGYGIRIQQEFETDPVASNNTIMTNLIGVTSSGSAPLANGKSGIFVDGHVNHIGSNTISGNSDAGMDVRGNSNSIFQNKIGVGPSGDLAVPNSLAGVVVFGSGNSIVSNVVSGNGGTGVVLQKSPDTGLSPSNNVIEQNIIGLNASQVSLVPNHIGILLNDAKYSSIYDNTIAGNTSHGIALIQSSFGNDIKRNYIGLNNLRLPFPNGGKGIAISDSSNGNKIGGNSGSSGLIGMAARKAGYDSSGNIIAHNSGGGIDVAADAGTGNALLSNLIYSNTGFGIKIGSQAFVPNDLGDADSGPNNLQNFPEIVSKDTSTGDLIITFKVDSDPAHSDYGSEGLYIEFFKMDNGIQGERYLGYTYYTEAIYGGGSPGTQTVNLGPLTDLGITASERITATATDASGNSSGYSISMVPTSAGVTIAGKVITHNSQPISRAVLTLSDGNGRSISTTTNSFGRFSFPDIQAGRTYFLRVSHRRHTFTTATQVINADDNLTGLEFRSIP